MKYLSDYKDKPMEEMLKKNGAFFAFGDDQFLEKRVKGVEYVSMSMGLIAPKENARHIWDETERIHKEGIEQDIKEHSKKKIIFRECENYEIQFGDTQPVYDSLEEYPITRKEIEERKQRFIKYYIKGDM